MKYGSDENNHKLSISYELLISHKYTLSVEKKIQITNVFDQCGANKCHRPIQNFHKIFMILKYTNIIP